MTNKKWFTSLAVALTLLITGCNALPTHPAAGDIPPQIVEWATKNVWRVEKATGTASAFFINNRQLVTACHVVDDITEGVVGNYNKSQVIAFNVVSCNKETDVAILDRDFGVEVDFTTSKTPVSDVLPREGRRVYGAGYPLWWDLTIVQGNFGKVVYTPYSGGRRYTSSVPIMFGDSGSPLLSIRHRRVYVEGVRIEITGFIEWRAPIYVPHMAMSNSGKDILNELNKDE